MNSESVGDPQNAEKAGRRRLLLLLFITAALGATAWGLRRAASRVEIPEVRLNAARPALVELMRQSRDRVRNSPKSAGAWGAYGMCLMQHDRPTEALVCFREAARLAPDSPRWPYYAGVISEQTDYDQAEEFYRQALMQDTAYAPLRLRLARTLSHLGQHSEAVETLQPLLTSAPESSGAWAEVMRLARVSGDLKLASQTLERARSAGIMSREFLLEAAIVSMLQGNPEEAMQERSAAENLPDEVSPENDPWMNEVRQFDVSGFMESQHADALVQNGRFMDAMSSFSRLSQKFPERSRPAFNHALVLLSLGQIDDGIAELSKLRDSFSQDPMIHFYLAQALIRKTDYDAAEKSLQKAIQLKPDFGRALTLLGNVYEQTQRLSRAAECYASAVLENPAELDAHLNLTRLLIELGRDQEAKHALEQAEKLPAAGGPLQDELHRLQALLKDESTNAP